MESIDDLNSIFGEVISAYPRAQALADGALIDVTVPAAEVGFKIPVAITAAAWAEVVEWSDADSARQTHQDERGRLHDVLWVAVNLARHYKAQNRMGFQHYRVPRGGRGTRRKPVNLVMVIGPGDAAEPVVTFMLPSDD
ncbi:DUF6573 family protein [Burkholderia vietnamiensis]|uniref:DUF6573 family protein n=1 Tax=Burkholderia vietnamiensis TaxID=60552 RepID=UPI0007591E96|nr:DUF6573 family protein [Burkholderia vietnamiensis]KVF76646.1 hypothetical protein WJ18_18590 [Burkholderia vietnamiensis]KVF84301.1 hypothetical protein WJ19_18975 [Burkholderia vietnamiensis]KVF90202.1 hypothetical protein WJ20_14030 [Burkholderia vietnamiensis]KVF96245.1 hypothetical protein WJ22_26400 [Burkholderia vietnamiensis]